MRLALGRGRRPGRASRESWQGTADALRGPLFAAVGAGPAYQGGFGFSGRGRHRTVSVTVRHASASGALDVETDDRGSMGEQFDDWRLVNNWFHRAVRPDELQFPLTVTAERWTQDVEVDGVPCRFTFVGGSDAWCAAGTVAGRAISITGTRWSSVGLALGSVLPREVRRDACAVL